jgi:hypothetical protein
MLTQIVTAKPELNQLVACNQSGLAGRSKLARFSLDSDACFIDVILRFLRQWLSIALMRIAELQA